TAAVVKLFPMSKGRELAWASVASPAKALELYQKATEIAAPSLTMFELMAQTPLDFVLRHMPETAYPLTEESPWHVLMEVSSARSAGDAREVMAILLSEAYE